VAGEVRGSQRAAAEKGFPRSVAAGRGCLLRGAAARGYPLPVTAAVRGSPRAVAAGEAAVPELHPHFHTALFVRYRSARLGN